LVVTLLHQVGAASDSIVATTSEQEAPQGCCFSVGFGALMRPCCLSTKPSVLQSACSIEKRLGGATGFVSGACPKDADEAALQLSQLTDKATTKADALLQMISRQKAVNGCCYSIGYGSLMRPCCLTTRMVEDMSSCIPADRGVQVLAGGAIGFSEDGCPSTADEAGKLIQAKRSSDKESVEALAGEAMGPIPSAASLSATSAVTGNPGAFVSSHTILLFTVITSVAGLAAAVTLVRGPQENTEDERFIRLAD